MDFEGLIAAARAVETLDSRAVSRAVKTGELRRLASRLYTKNLEDPPEEVVRRNLWGIVAGYFPGALVADRTALEAAPAPDGSVFLVSQRGRTIELPGILLRPRRGAGPLESDMPFVGGLYLSAMARAYLENMRPSRARTGRVARTLTRAELEERLDGLIRALGEAGVNRLRDNARVVAAELGMETEAAQLDTLIGTLLGTRESRLDSSLGRAHGLGVRTIQTGWNCSTGCTSHSATIPSAFGRVLCGIPRRARRSRSSRRISPTSSKVRSFWWTKPSESFRRGDPAAQASGRTRRGRDMAHRLRSSRDEPDTPRFRTHPEGAASRDHGRTPRDTPRRVQGGPESGWSDPIRRSRPGIGDSGTGLSLYLSLESPFARAAAYMMFLVSENTPLCGRQWTNRARDDERGAGRRGGGGERIIIPTVFRDNYLAALRALSRTGRADPLIRVLDYAQRWTLTVDWSSIPETQRELEACKSTTDEPREGP